MSIWNTEKWDIYPDLPTPSQLFGSDREMNSEEPPATLTECAQMAAGETHQDKRVAIYTISPRTAASPISGSLMSRERTSHATASPSNSELMSPPNLRSATTFSDYAPTASVQEETGESDGVQLNPKWELCEPCYRSDEPAMPHNTDRTNEQMHVCTYPPPEISSEGNVPMQDTQNMMCTAS